MSVLMSPSINGTAHHYDEPTSTATRDDRTRDGSTMGPGPGFESYAFVQRMGPNVALIHPWPDGSAQRVCEALDDAGLPFDLVGQDQPGGGAVICFFDDDFEDELLGVIADQLSRRGIGAFAHALVHSDIADAHVDVFTRTGSCHPLSGRGVVLVHTYIHDVPEGIGATTWIFGAPDDLVTAATALSATFDVEPVRDPDGIATLEIPHPEVAAGLDLPRDAQRAVVATLGQAGLEGPILVTNNASSAM